MIELKGLAKSFGDCQATIGINLKVKRGSIHAIIGENGAGKSTAMKMLFGLYAPDEGAIWVDGKQRHWRSPRDAINAGIGMVHQHFMLAGPETALENVLLESNRSKDFWSWLPPFLRPIDRASALNKLQKLCAHYHLSVDWNSRIEDLPVGVQQRIEILKLLYVDASVLILDEPTAVLTPQETAQLFANLRKLASEGKTILIITHKLKEVLSVADQVTVFRSGRTVGFRDLRKEPTSAEDLASMMVGRKVALSGNAATGERKAFALSYPVLRFTGAKSELKFSVHSGEIVGIAGVEGNGQSELLQALLHPKEFPIQEIFYGDQSALEWSSAHVRKSGVAMIPEDRLQEGLLLEQDLSENFLLGLQRRKLFQKRGFISWKTVREKTDLAIRNYDIRPADRSAIVGRLSGGNQQKLIIAREFEPDPSFLIAAQPTRGVDVGAIESIHSRILEARDQGKGVLLISSELDEIFALSDRVLVIYEGAIVAEMKRETSGQSFDENKIGLYMAGGAK
jgi:simple sugar transport system ATP-binding protein